MVIDAENANEENNNNEGVVADDVENEDNPFEKRKRKKISAV